MSVTATFVVQLSKVWDEAVTVHYATQDGTATAGEDYASTAGNLTFAPGQTSKNVAVEVFDRLAGSPDEWFRLLLSAPVNATLANSSATCTIELPEVSVSNGPLIKSGLVTNAFHNAEGRGGYFHANSGTSEGQSIGIQGALQAYLQLHTGTTEEQAAAAWYKTEALAMLDALGDGTATGPMLRQAIPTDPNTICMLHWLFAARGDIPSQAINYDFHVTKTGSKLVIPATVPVGSLGQEHHGGPDVFRIWKIYPHTSYLLYSSPYSPSYDSTAPAGDTSIEITDADWSHVGNTVEINIPGGAPGGVTDWNVIYGYQNAGTINQGDAEEAYPNWTAIPDGYVACAPDTYRWFDYAMNLAITVDDRAGKAAQWTNLRNAMRRTAVRGQSLTDLREVIKPLPQFPVIPLSGEPSGMFCYSDHPSALPPTTEQIAAGANPEWIGFNFWSRIGGEGGSVAPGEFTWTPQNMFFNPDDEDYFNGAIKCTVPSGSGQVQLGRGINDEWRLSTAYHEPDQYLFIALTISKKPTGSEKIYVYLSSTKFYSAATRWYAEIGAADTLLADPVPDTPVYLMIPRTSFLRKDGDNSVLPAGTRFENFGISYEMAGPYTSNLVAMRLVSGASTAWVDAHMAQAVAGAPVPFFPGAMPFATNADIPKQQFVGWNGSPFHGYQLPDYWWFLGGDADAVHPNLDPTTDLPIPDPSTGAITYPISATTAGSVTKPRNALLMEQQLMFLKAAQDKWTADGGAEGPFAHTFVLDTPARISLGNPTPSTWVYINDDPNTRWLGYQCRVVDSLARLVLLTKDTPSFDTARGLALTMVMKWLTQLNAAWPNLTGVTVTDPNTGDPLLVKGSPTDYIDPALGDPQTNYDEPHGPSLILRACMWLIESGLLSSPQLVTVNAVGKRCWDYLELRYRSTAGDSMRYTWANNSSVSTEEYYGFWEFEIISTLAYLLEHPGSVPTGIDLATVRLRLVQTQSWLAGNVE